MLPGNSLLVVLLFLGACCIGPCVGSSGGVVNQNGQWAVRLPDNYAFGEVGKPLMDVHVEDGVPAPEDASDMTVTLFAGSDNTLHIRSGRSTSAGDGMTALAWAEYKNTVKETGWGYLKVGATDDTSVGDDLKLYASGFLEGFSSARQIRDFQHNANALMGDDEKSHQANGNIRSLFSRTIKSIQKKSGMDGSGVVLSNTSPQADDNWSRHARYMLMQAWGLADAYNLHSGRLSGTPMSMVDLFILNSDGETPELEMAYDSQEVLLRHSGGTDGVVADAGSDDDSGKSFLQKRRKVEAHKAQKRFERGHIGSPGYAELKRKAQERRHRTLRNMDDKAWRKFKARYGRCSALVRLTSDNRDLMLGHTTFSDFGEMNRIYKYYDFPLQGSPSRRMGFSSYPGVMGSTDDFYVIDTGLAVTETTVSMLSDEAFDKLNDDAVTVPDYMRIMMSNRLATTGEEWVNYMKQSATGTYNSQWMVVDYNLFQPGQQLQPGTLWVLEQAPGASHAEDMSTRLQSTGYWASENRAYFDDVRRLAGETEAEETQGNMYSADHNPRANIFAKTAPEITNLADMRAEMRRNRWPNDVDGGPSNTPDHAIAARSDLAKDSPRANGGVDSKVTNACLAKQLSADAVSGPSHDSQTPFRWTDDAGRPRFPDQPRDGQPDVWNFDWARFTPDSELAHLPNDECSINGV